MPRLGEDDDDVRVVDEAPLVDEPVVDAGVADHGRAAAVPGLALGGLGKLALVGSRDADHVA
jgi:hypothetical protein